MTEIQKEQIAVLRRAGLGYKRTAQSLGLSVDAVKSYCRKHDLTSAMPPAPKNADACLSCGKPIVQLTKRKPRKFCSAACREDWWKRNRDKVKKRTGSVVPCLNCGREFSAYEREARRYCCHACYIAHRFKGGDGRE